MFGSIRSLKPPTEEHSQDNCLCKHQYPYRRQGLGL